MKVHPRTLKVQGARAELSRLLLDFQEQQDLTDVEMLGLLLHHAERTHIWLLRAERHPRNPSKKADEA